MDKYVIYVFLFDKVLIEKIIVFIYNIYIIIKISNKEIK